MNNKQILVKLEQNGERTCLSCRHSDIPVRKTPCYNCFNGSCWDPEETIVKCKDCKHKPVKEEPYENGLDLNFPDDVCPLRVPDPWYSQMPDDDWFCANGEKEDKS